MGEHRVTTNATRRRERSVRAKRERDIAMGIEARPIPPETPQVASVISVCRRCDRRGLVSSESSVCVGIRTTVSGKHFIRGGVQDGFEPRSKRCEDISDRKLDRLDRLAS